MCICIPVYISGFMWILLLTTQVLGRVDGGWVGWGGSKSGFDFCFFPSQKNVRYIFWKRPLPPSLEWALATWLLVQHLLCKLNFRTPHHHHHLSGLFTFLLMRETIFQPVNRFFFFFAFLVFIANSHSASFNVPKIVFHWWVKYCQPLCTTLQAFAQLCKLDLWN